MGVVYQARQIGLDRVVALKMIRAGDLARAEDLARFKSEAEALARLKHVNIVQIYEVDEREGRPFFALEYVAGGTLADQMDGRPQAPRTAARLTEVLARAIHAAHQSGVIHRDLKPANILLQRDDSGSQPSASPPAAPCNLEVAVPKITDFGLAKRLDREGGQTETGTVMGTPSYMAPEQAAGKTREIGAAADIYALGAILYELLTGRPPFLGESWHAIRDLVLSTEPVPPRRLLPKLSRDLQTICLRCLEKAPAKRFASALELADELRRYLSGEPIRSRPVGAAERLWRWARRKPALAGLSGLATLTVAVAIILAFGFMLFKSRLSREERLNEATTALDRGIDLCERGQSGQGMLWLAHSLTLTPVDLEAENLRRAIGANLGAWCGHVNALKEVLPHSADVEFVAFSPDGRTLLTATHDETCLWTVGGQRIARLSPHRGQVLAASFSADGKTILTRSRSRIQKWDSTTGTLLGPPLEAPYEVSSASFGPDGQAVLTGSRQQKAAQLWNSSTGEPRGHALKHQDMVIAVALSHDGKTALTGSNTGQAQLWNVASGAALGAPLPYSGQVNAVAFSPDDRTILVGSDGKAAHLWNVETRQLIRQFDHQESVTAVTFSPDGATVLTGSEDASARLWVRGTGKPIGSPLMHRAGIRSVAFSPDGKMVLSGGADQTARLWQVAAPLEPTFVFPHRAPVYKVAFRPDGKAALTVGLDGQVRLWDVATGQAGSSLSHKGPVTDALFSPDGETILTRTSDSAARLWNAVSGQCIKSFSHQSGVVLAIGADAGWDSIVTAGSDKTACLWSPRADQAVKMLPHAAPVYCAALSPDGQTILTGSGEPLGRIWDAATGTVRVTLAHEAPVVCAAFSSDGALALTADDGGTARLWDPATGAAVGQALQHKAAIYVAAFSRDGQRVVTAGKDKVARIWDARTGEARGVFPHQATVWSVALTHDRRTLLTGSDDHSARFWDVGTARPIAPALPHEGAVASVALSPDGKTMLTGSFDHKGRLWNVPVVLETDAARLRCWTSVITGIELDETASVRVLDAQGWQGRRQDLQSMGGPPVR